MKPFPWRPGMRAIDKRGTPWRVYLGAGGLCGQGELIGGYCGDWDGIAPLLEAKPDESDPATLGALLGAAEEAWAPIGVLTVVAPVAATLGEPWRVRLTDRVGAIRAVFAGRTRFDALMAAWWSSP